MCNSCGPLWPASCFDTWDLRSAGSAGPPSIRAETLELGRRIAVEGFGKRKIPACQSCHGATGRERNPLYPSLAGQPEWYLSKHLRLWKEGHRGGTEYAHVMDEVASNLTEEQIKAVSAWYSGLPNIEP